MEHITYAELVRRIQQGTISKEELAEFFELDPSKTRAFQPIFRVNTAVVDVDGVELAALASGHELALCSLNRLQERILESHPDAKLPYNVIAEGDSWFQHPLVTTVIDALQHRGHRIKNLAWPGDTFEDVLKYKEYVPHLQARTVKCFLFSAGGNDVLGTIEEVINRYDGVHTDPNNPAHVKYYINSRFTLKLRKIIDNYGELNDDVRALSSNTLLMIHGYAYARPKVHGTSLGKHFEALGFNLSDARVLQLALAIVKEVVDQLNAVLETFADNHRPMVRYFDLRHVVLQNDNADWYDELHPSKQGANKVANVFEPALPVTVVAA